MGPILDDWESAGQEEFTTCLAGSSRTSDTRDHDPKTPEAGDLASPRKVTINTPLVPRPGSEPSSQPQTGPLHPPKQARITRPRTANEPQRDSIIERASYLNPRIARTMRKRSSCSNRRLRSSPSASATAGCRAQSASYLRVLFGTSHDQGESTVKSTALVDRDST